MNHIETMVGAAAGFSPPILLEAFEAVYANHGCAGVDQISLDKFAENLGVNLGQLAAELNDGSYHPLPLMKIVVSKKNGEGRNLSIPTVRDRIAQKALLLMIEPIVEREFETCSYAYRAGRSVNQAVAKVLDYYEKGHRWVVEADIDAFFDTLDHGLLMGKVQRLLSDLWVYRLVELWIKAEVWDGERLSTLEKGIPQGSAISPLLANLALDELDEKMLKYGFKYVRYADDFLILCKSREKAEEALEMVQNTLADLHLVLDDMNITTFDQGFTFLGVQFLRSMALKPIMTKKRERKVLYYPPPFDMKAYLKNR